MGPAWQWTDLNRRLKPKDLISRRALLTMALAVGCAKRGDVLPDFRGFLDDLPRHTAGRVPFEPSRLEGRVVLITFLATWCFPCLTELVVLQRLERDHGGRGFSNVLVGMDLEGKMVLAPFAEVYKLSAPLVIADERIRSGESAFGRIRELPTRLLFGRSGKLILAYSGVSKYEELDRAVTLEISRT